MGWVMGRVGGGVEMDVTTPRTRALMDTPSPAPLPTHPQKPKKKNIPSYPIPSTHHQPLLQPFRHPRHGLGPPVDRPARLLVLREPGLELRLGELSGLVWGGVGVWVWVCGCVGGGWMGGGGVDNSEQASNSDWGSCRGVVFVFFFVFK